MNFSITIPAYKTRFLRECIDSVLAQTYTDFEVIILNDASPEDIDGIVHSFTDNRIRYYKNEENVGAVNLVDNWNKCLELAKGDYIICMGDDDRLMPDCLEQYARMIEKYPSADLFHARTLRINEKGEPIAVSHGYPEHERVFQFMLHRLNYGIQFIGDFCYRTESLKRIGGYYRLPLAWGTDDITAYMAAKENGVVNIQEPTFCYRSNEKSITNSGNMQLKLDAVSKMYAWYVDFIKRTAAADQTEELCKKELSQRLNTFFRKKRSQLLSETLRQHRLSIVKWIFCRRRYHLSLADIALAVYYARK